MVPQARRGVNYFNGINLFGFPRALKNEVKRLSIKSHYLVVAKAVFAELYERRIHWPERESGQ
jgi:hypothetical protein